jgi:hypothetical protein
MRPPTPPMVRSQDYRYANRCYFDNTTTTNTASPLLLRNKQSNQTNNLNKAVAQRDAVADVRRRIDSADKGIYAAIE